MHWGVSDGDRQFLADFSAGQVAAGDFDHVAHLRLAYVVIACAGWPAAVAEFSTLLKRFLAHHNVDPTKFHATLTDAWLRAVHRFMVDQTVANSSAFLAANRQLHDPAIMHSHYSPELLYGNHARNTVIAPNLAPIEVTDCR